MLDNLKVTSLFGLDKKSKSKQDKQQIVSIGAPSVTSIKISSSYNSIKSLEQLSIDERSQLKDDYIKNASKTEFSDKELLNRLQKGIYSSSAPHLPMLEIDTNSDNFHPESKLLSLPAKNIVSASSDFIGKLELGSPLPQGIDKLLSEKLASKGLRIDNDSHSLSDNFNYRKNENILSAMSPDVQASNTGLSIKDRIKMLNHTDLAKFGSTASLKNNYESTSSIPIKTNIANNDDLSRRATAKKIAESISLIGSKNDLVEGGHNYQHNDASIQSSISSLNKVVYPACETEKDTTESIGRFSTEIKTVAQNIVVVDSNYRANSQKAIISENKKSFYETNQLDNTLEFSDIIGQDVIVIDKKNGKYSPKKSSKLAVETADNKYVVNSEKNSPI